MHITFNRRAIYANYGIGFCYAEKNGFAVLKTEKSFRKINGFYINTGRGCVWVIFRRNYNWR